MARILGIAGIQMNVVYGQDNSDAMLIKLNIVKELFVTGMLLPEWHYAACFFVLK